MLINVSPKLKTLARLLPSPLYIVGGYVRNSLLGLPLDDIDICGAIKLDKLVRLLSGSEFSVKIKSRATGTAIISCEDEKYEYSCFRKEEYSPSGSHSPVSVEFITSVQEDAKRRDFTINALYYDILRDELIDFYNGVDDIKKKVIRTVENPDIVLAHDGVRILRVFRFQAELNFKIDKETLACAIKYAQNLRSITDERIVYEISRILGSGSRYADRSKPNAFMPTFKLFNRYGLWAKMGLDVPRIKLNMVKKTEHKTQGLLIDILDSVRPISISYYLQSFLQNLGLNKKVIANLINIISGYYDALNGLNNKQYFFKYFDNFPTILKLLESKSHRLAAKYEFFYKYIISHRLVISLRDLKISGEDIKKHYPHVEAKRYKAILNSLLSDVFDGKVENTNSSLVEAVEAKLKYL